MTSYLDTIQSELAKSNPTHAMSCSPDKQTDTCQASPSGTTWQPSMEIRGADQLTFFAEDSPAKTSLRQVKEQELPANVRDYGRNMRDSLAKCGLDLSLPKTHHCFALGDLELSSKTWPRWGIMLDGECSELGLSVRRTSETECGSWPTPKAGQCGMSAKTSGRDVTKSTHLTTQVALAEGMINLETGRMKWPTPDANMGNRGTQPNWTPLRKSGHTAQYSINQAVKDSGKLGGTPTQQKYPTPTCMMGAMFAESNWEKRNSPSLASHVKYISPTTKEQKKKSSQLNPPWVEWLMGWPIGWTDLKPLATGKYRNVQLWHLTFSQKD